MPSSPSPGSTARTRVRRIPEKAVTDRDALNAILDAGLVAHVAVVVDGQPFVLPVAYARDGERLLIHGSTASRLFRALADGANACVTVTLLDGLVVARSAFESSMHYRSVMALGRFSPLTGDEHLAGIRLITEHLIPGRWDEVRPPLAKELKATSVLAMDLVEVSVKVSDGPPDDAEQDLTGPAWAGVIPLASAFGPARAADDLAPGIEIPASVHRLIPPS
jgi:nitroimidazol reductase NimA-like FMN-containing flavoprotein (pyridoxamine 5'-phosphate oxidase superfamily)